MCFSVLWFAAPDWLNGFLFGAPPSKSRSANHASANTSAATKMSQRVQGPGVGGSGDQNNAERSVAGPVFGWRIVLLVGHVSDAACVHLTAVVSLRTCKRRWKILHRRCLVGASARDATTFSHRSLCYRVSKHSSGAAGRPIWITAGYSHTQRRNIHDLPKSRPSRGR